MFVDAPCLGIGSWRRNPDGKWRATPQDLAELVVRQRDILASAARLVKPGGRLIYVTCSLLREENEAQAEAFLAASPDFALYPMARAWAETIGGRSPGGDDYLRLTPARHRTDGFFVAQFERVFLSRSRRHDAKPTMTLQPDDRILILDFGSQVTQLIARRVRENGVYCEIWPYTASAAAIRDFAPRGHHPVGRAGLGDGGDDAARPRHRVRARRAGAGDLLRHADDVRPIGRPGHASATTRSSAAPSSTSSGSAFCSTGCGPQRPKAAGASRCG